MAGGTGADAAAGLVGKDPAALRARAARFPGSSRRSTIISPGR